MITDPLKPGYHGRTNQLLLARAASDRAARHDRWLDEAAEHALNGNPRRAAFIEWMVATELSVARGIR